MLELITPHWPAPPNVRALTTTRKGGVSKPPYDSMNLALHVEDAVTNVLENRSALANHIAVPASSFAWLEQVHGRRIVDARRVQGVVEADASYVRKPGAVCVVMTADCLPVLLCDRQGSLVAAVHAGWRGLAANILGHALELFDQPSEVLVWLGPAIGPGHFEVGMELCARFSELEPGYAHAFSKRGQQLAANRYLADIYQLARYQLLLAGVSEGQVYGGDFCTFADTRRFYSYRRDGAHSGRMATAIWLQD